VILLQFGGASGQGFIGPDRVKQARLEMEKEGRFEGGIFTRDVTEGRRNWDAYEAIWLHVMRGELSYAPPVYKTPIVMRPEALPWLSSSEEGVSVRRIGVFPHRGLSLDAWRIEPGARHQVPAHRALRLSFVTEGSGTMNGAELRRWSAVRMKPGESASVIATSRLELLEMTVRPVGALSAKPHETPRAQGSESSDDR
jgi:hypothetical protein